MSMFLSILRPYTFEIGADDVEVLRDVSSERHCSFNPPTIQDALSKRRALGTTVDADGSVLVPSFVPCGLFGTHTAVPGTIVPVPFDEDSGYRTLAYLLLFDEDLHWLMRQVLSSYVILHAAEPWVKSKSHVAGTIALIELGIRAGRRCGSGTE